MRSYLFFVLLLIGLADEVQAQWTESRGIGGSDLNSVYFANASTGWAVGGSGTILKTINGGITWTSQTSGTTAPLLAIRFTDLNTGYAVGGSGSMFGGLGSVLLKTTNGGTTWSPQNSGTTATALSAIDFADSNTGWAVGTEEYIYTIPGYNLTGKKNNFLKTTDGGVTWTKQTQQISGNGYDGLSSVDFIDKNVGYAVGVTKNGIPGESGTVLKTTDGGITWTVQVSTGIPRLHSVHFVTSNIGWAVGTACILSTTNGGATWTPQSIPQADTLRSVYFTTQLTGYAAGSGGILKTTNGGTTWTTSISNTATKMNSVYFIDANTGYTAGRRGFILKTTNGGVPTAIFTLQPDNLFTINDQNIRYTLLQTSPVQASIFDSRGRKILKLLDATQQAGNHFVDLSSFRLNQGPYFLDFKSGGARETMQNRILLS